MKASRICEYNRLAYYREDSFTWDRHWAPNINADSLFPPNAYDLGQLNFMLPYLPRKGRVLEAGCGMGQIVYLLRKNGFDCDGVDNAAETIARIRELKPDLPLRVEDLLQLSVPDATYSGLVSLGVVEHRQQGPEPFLIESLRILEPGGVAIFTVPHFSPLRRIKARLGCYKARVSGNFYQYAFTLDEFTRFVEQAGFEVIAKHYYDVWKGLKDEIPPLAWLNKKACASRMALLFNKQQWLLPHVAHMLALVCRKPAVI